MVSELDQKLMADQFLLFEIKLELLGVDHEHVSPTKEFLGFIYPRTQQGLKESAALTTTVV